MTIEIMQPPPRTLESLAPGENRCSPTLSAPCLSSMTQVFIFAILSCLQVVRAGGLDWPADRLLPSFAAPAAMIDCIDLGSASYAEVDLFTSLEGVVNQSQPRIACVTDKFIEGKFTWLELHKLAYSVISGYDAVAKYRNEVTGLVVTDPQQPDTLNLATTLAGLNRELICSPLLLSKLTNAPYNLQIKDDLRHRFADKYQVYQFLYDQCWPRCTHRIFTGMGRNVHGSLRDYIVAVKSAAVWLDPANTRDRALLALFFSSLKPAGAVYMGWWPNEPAGMRFAGHFGIPVLASDLFNNASLFGGVIQPMVAPNIPPPPGLENKIYVSFFLSDGDNVQYMQHHMKRSWQSPARGSVPIGWTVSPLAVDLDPVLLNFYRATATTNDCLVAGPSGAGYGRLDFWKAGDLGPFTKLSDQYFRRSGLQITTIWLQVTDAIGNMFATNCPTLIGLTSQDGGSFNTLHLGLPTIGLAANYESHVPVLISSITEAAKHWSGTTPLFVSVQANGWHLTPADCRTIAAALDKNTFTVVRPDHLFELLKLAHNRLKPESPI
jgi:hypothetical protein